MNKEKLKQFREKFNNKETFLGVVYNKNQIDKLFRELIDAVLEEEESTYINEIKKLDKSYIESKSLKKYIIEHSSTFYFGDIPPTSDSSGTTLYYKKIIMAINLEEAHKIAKERFTNILSIVEVK